MTNETAILLPELDRAQHKLKASALKNNQPTLAATRVWVQGRSWVADSFMAIGIPSPAHPFIGEVRGLEFVVNNALENAHEDGAACYEFNVNTLVARLRYLITMKAESRFPFVSKNTDVYFKANTYEEDREEAFKLVGWTSLEEKEQEFGKGKFQHLCLSAERLLAGLEGCVSARDIDRACYLRINGNLNSVFIAAPKRSIILMPNRV